MTNKTPLIISSIVIIVAALGIGGYYLMKSRESKKVTSDASPTPSSQASPTISSSTNDVTIETELNETNVTEDDTDLKALEADINQL
jgi:flagellar basal body-associated protein FliL